MSSLVCDIVTPEAKLLSGEYYMVVVPGVEGEMGFLQGHAPLVSALSDGAVRLRKEAGDNADVIVLQGGYVEVTGEKVIVLADRACPIEAIDQAAVVVEREEAVAHLEELGADDAGRAMLESVIAWCDLRLKAVGAA